MDGFLQDLEYLRLVAEQTSESRGLDSALKWHALANPATGGSPQLRRALGVLSGVPPSLMDDIDNAEADALDELQNADPAGGLEGADAAGSGAPGMTQNGPEAGDPAGEFAPDELAAAFGALGQE